MLRLVGHRPNHGHGHGHDEGRGHGHGRTDAGDPLELAADGPAKVDAGNNAFGRWIAYRAVRGE